MNRKRTWLHLTLALLLFSSISAAAAEKPVTLVHMTHAWHGDGWHNFVRQMAAEFMELHPHVKVEIMINGADYLDKLRVMTAAGSPPDITDLNSGNGYLSLDGMFLDLAPYLDREDASVRANILDNALKLYTTEGVVWGMPNSLFMVVSWFNKDLLDVAGLAYPSELPLSDWNWDTLRSYARKLAVDRDGDGVNEQWGLDRQSAAWLQLVAANGGYMYERRDDPTTSLWNSESVLQATEFNRQLMRDDRVATVAWDANTHFWTGRSGMAIVDGPGRLASLMDVDFKWDIAMQPAGPNGCNCGSVSADGFQINAYSENPDMAWEYLKFLTVRTESIYSFVNHTGRFPALAGVHDAYPSVNPDAPDNWRAFVDTAAHPGAYLAPTIPAADRITQIQNTFLDQIWQGRTAARVALQQIHEQVQKILNERH